MQENINFGGHKKIICIVIWILDILSKEWRTSVVLFLIPDNSDSESDQLKAEADVNSFPTWLLLIMV